MSISYNSINASVNTNSIDQQLTSFMSTMDPNSSYDMVQLQAMMQQWEIAYSTKASCYKALYTCTRGILDKFP